MRVCQLAVANLPETGFQLAGRKCCLPAALMDLKGIAAKRSGTKTENKNKAEKSPGGPGGT